MTKRGEKVRRMDAVSLTKRYHHKPDGSCRIDDGLPQRIHLGYILFQAGYPLVKKDLYRAQLPEWPLVTFTCLD